jgi:hypothetical protein
VVTMAGTAATIWGRCRITRLLTTDYTTSLTSGSDTAHNRRSVLVLHGTWDVSERRKTIVNTWIPLTIMVFPCSNVRYSIILSVFSMMHTCNIRRKSGLNGPASVHTPTYNYYLVPKSLILI